MPLTTLLVEWSSRHFFSEHAQRNPNIGWDQHGQAQACRAIASFVTTAMWCPASRSPRFRLGFDEHSQYSLQCGAPKMAHVDILYIYVCVRFLTLATAIAFVGDIS